MRSFSILIVCFLSSILNAQTCSLDLTKNTSKLVPSSFGMDDKQLAGGALFQEVNSSQVNVIAINMAATNSIYSAELIDDYQLSKIDNRIVSGDFNGDSKRDELLVFYDDNGLTRVDYFKYSTWNQQFHITKGVFTIYEDPDDLTGMIVSGEFTDSDYSWDVAFFLDNGPGMKMNMLRIWGDPELGEMTVDPSYWSINSGYTPDQIKGRIVCGDFDRDNYTNDIAAFYDYGNGEMKIHVWENLSQNSFNFSHAFHFSSGYTLSNINERIVVGDFDEDNKEDDIAAFYDYGNGATRIHVFETKSQSQIEFEYSNNGYGHWSVSSGYTADNIDNRIVAFDESTVGDKSNSSICAIYNYGSNTTKFHKFEAETPLGSNDYFSYSHLDFCGAKSIITNNENESLTEEAVVASVGDKTDMNEIRVFPNPSTSGRFLLSEAINVAKYKVYNTEGRLIVKTELLKNYVDLSDFDKGIYIVELFDTSDDIIGVYKLIKQ